MLVFDLVLWFLLKTHNLKIPGSILGYNYQNFHLIEILKVIRKRQNHQFKLTRFFN